MSGRKAARPAIDKSIRKPRAVSAWQQRDREATPLDYVMQALAVYDGQRCIGRLLPRGKQSVEAFDADDKSLGIFPDQKTAAAAVVGQAGQGLTRKNISRDGSK